MICTHWEYAARTRLNALAADGILMLNVGELSGGTAYTVDVAREDDKPFIVIQLEESAEPCRTIDWIAQHEIHVLNVAGPREGKQPGSSCPGD